MDTVRETQVLSDNPYILETFAEYIVLGLYYT